MFLDGKVVENNFRWTPSLWPQEGDRHVFVCITLAIKRNSVKIVLFLCLASTPARTHISYPFPIPQPTLATCLSSIYVKIIWKWAISVCVWTLSAGVGVSWGEVNPPFIIHSRLFHIAADFSCNYYSASVATIVLRGVWREGRCRIII